MRLPPNETAINNPWGLSTRDRQEISRHCYCHRTRWAFYNCEGFFRDCRTRLPADQWDQLCGLFKSLHMKLGLYLWELLFNKIDEWKWGDILFPPPVKFSLPEIFLIHSSFPEICVLYRNKTDSDSGFYRSKSSSDFNPPHWLPWKHLFSQRPWCLDEKLDSCPHPHPAFTELLLAGSLLVENFFLMSFSLIKKIYHLYWDIIHIS